MSEMKCPKCGAEVERSDGNTALTECGIEYWIDSDGSLYAPRNESTKCVQRQVDQLKIKLDKIKEQGDE